MFGTKKAAEQHVAEIVYGRLDLSTPVSTAAGDPASDSSSKSILCIIV